MRLRQREWVLGERLDGGGFGQVYEVKSADGDIAAAKLIPKKRGARRELLFEDDLAGMRNVVPVIDSGETDTHWVIVMPKAEKSLRKYLVEAGGPLEIADAVAILSDIAVALSDLDGKVVHRDLKPENVLLLGGAWCLADFGISRYAEAATASDTRKPALTPEYAAPERWRYERATIATDVYSLGVIAHELLSGSLPFAGPEPFQFQEQHLHADPPRLPYVLPMLGALVDECLFKAPEARPSPANVVTRLRRIAEPPASAGLARLEEAHRAEVERLGEAARRESQARSESERRAALFDAAKKGLARISDALEEAIRRSAPSARISKDRLGWRIELGQAALELGTPAETGRRPWGSWTPPAFEVLAQTTLSLTIPADRYEYEGRSHSLWYCDAQEAGRYRWFETAFMYSAFSRQRGRQNPFALDPGTESAKALWAGIAEFQLAWPFTVVDVGDMDEFINLWGGWFAAAAQGQLQHPSSMPERPAQGGYRRA